MTKWKISVGSEPIGQDDSCPSCRMNRRVKRFWIILSDDNKQRYTTDCVLLKTESTCVLEEKGTRGYLLCEGNLIIVDSGMIIIKEENRL